MVKDMQGVKEALYHFFECDTPYGYTKERVISMVQNWPEHIYMGHCIVIVNQTFECGRIYLEDFNATDEGHRLL